MALLLVLAGYAQPVRAEFFQFHTTVTILSSYIPVGSTVSNNSTAHATLTTPSPEFVDITLNGEVSGAPPVDENIDATFPGSDIVFGTIDVANLAHDTELVNIELPYTFHIVVDDYTTYNSVGVNGSATFDITGKVTGTVGKVGGGKQVNLSTNTYDPGNVLSKVIGGQIYTLVLNTYVPPGPTNTGAFGAHVIAQPVPEPGTVVLLSLGALLLATPAIWRRRRKSWR